MSMFRTLGSGTILLAIVIFGILAVMMVPVPTGLLDLIITFNIAFALLVLLVTLYHARAAGVLRLPESAARAHAAAALPERGLHAPDPRGGLRGTTSSRAFGEFVVSGNPVIGLVIFIILVVIQFVVITKGAGRVAEVGARFTLDAMPGKQMAIDADLNAGLIDENEARHASREDLAGGRFLRRHGRCFQVRAWRRDRRHRDHADQHSWVDS